MSATYADSDTPAYSITVGNGDSKFAISGSSRTIAVHADVDDNAAPVSDDSTYSFSMAEDMASSTVVGSMSATDADKTPWPTPSRRATAQSPSLLRSITRPHRPTR